MSSSSKFPKKIAFHWLIIGSMTRRAKSKLPKEIKKKVDEWKFSSGALVMCLVAYQDGDQVRSFQ